MKDQNIYILTIRDSIQRIYEYTEGYDLNAFLEDNKTQDAVIRNIEIIGQAVKDFGVQNLLQNFPDVPWQQITGMRNIIAHEYLGIDMTITWEVVNTSLSPLEHAIAEMVRELEEPGGS